MNKNIKLNPLSLSGIISLIVFGSKMRKSRLFFVVKIYETRIK